jgi:choice-of-anchor B domain-containing protein
MPAPAGAQLSLVSQTPVPQYPSLQNTDIWLWTDPNTGNEYACTGKYVTQGPSILTIFDVTNPFSPTVVNEISPIPGFDMKTWVDGDSVYMYLATGSFQLGVTEIWNVTDPTNAYWLADLPACHNIYIDSNGYLYLSYNSLMLYDLNADPANPTLLWTFLTAEKSHDVYVDEASNVLYDFRSWDSTYIFDISNLPAPPESLGTLPPSVVTHHHSGVTSADSRYLYLNDEIAGSTDPDITVWDVSDPENPFMVSYFHDPDATAHNSFRVGDHLFVSYYVAGLRVFDISDGDTLQLLDEYDTSPGFTGNLQFNGCFGVYPFSPSGYIFASDMENGLFVFSFTSDPTGIGDSGPQSATTLDQNYPNPFNPMTTISFHIGTGSMVSLAIFDAAGARIRALRTQYYESGPYSVTWDGRDDAGRLVASGVYFYRLEAGGRTETRRMTLLK